MPLACGQGELHQCSSMLAGALSGSGEGLGFLAHGGSVWDSGEWWMLLAAQSMAVGTVMVPWVSKFADPVMATGYHLLLGGLPLLALSACTEGGLLSERLPQLTGASPSCRHLPCAEIAAHVSMRLPSVCRNCQAEQPAFYSLQVSEQSLLPSKSAMGKGAAASS